MGCASSVAGRPLAVSPAMGIPVGNSVTGTSKEWSDDKLNFALQQMQSAVEMAQSSKLSKVGPLPKPLPVDWQSWEFNIFDVEHNDLPALAFTVLSSHPELSAPPSKIDKHKLWRFVNEIALRHNYARPFHSFRHGCDVLLAVSALLRMVRSDKPAGLDDPILIGGLLVGALVHDTNHPGCMNGYLIATQHPLAAESTAAVLERHHADMALTLLERPELNFLSRLSPDARTRFLAAVKETVLATDVTTTMPKAKEFGALVADGGQPTAQQVASLLIKVRDRPLRAACLACPPAFLLCSLRNYLPISLVSACSRSHAPYVAPRVPSYPPPSPPVTPKKRNIPPPSRVRRVEVVVFIL